MFKNIDIHNKGNKITLIKKCRQNNLYSHGAVVALVVAGVWPNPPNMIVLYVYETTTDEINLWAKGNNSD